MMEPVLEKKNLFSRRKRGFNNYRIPALAITQNGTILAACEARKKKSDWACRAIMMRRSTDGGKTWTRQIPIVKSEDKQWKEHPETALNNPLFIIDRNKPLIHFLYCKHYEQAFYMRSTDEGKSFSEPVEITSAFEPFREHFDWKVLATGPGKGIQLRSGRLIAPVWIAYGKKGSHHPSVCGVIYSDNSGKTWEAGQLIPTYKTDDMPNGSESYAVQKANGNIYFNFRNTSRKRRRSFSISPNGVGDWSIPKFDESLFEPICMASLIRFTERDTNGAEKNRILFSNPDSSDIPDPSRRMRKHLTIKMSYDECESWPIARRIEEGKSGYSDLAVDPDGMIYCLYERGGKRRWNTYYHNIAIAKFNLEWLTNGKDSLK